MYCFCKDYYLENFNGDYEFSDGKQHCETWLKYYSASQSLIYAVPFMISIINYFSKIVLRWLGTFEKRHNTEELMYSVAINLTLISFLNIAVMVLLVNLSINQKIPFIPILQGEYTEFSVEWYRLVGASLCVQLAFEIVTYNLENILTALYQCCKRCCDRSCTCNFRKTKKITQMDYEDINASEELQMEDKYASSLVVVLLVMMYGPGIPILYVIAMVYFFVTYWIDKCLIIRHHRKPLFLDEKLALSILWWYKLALLFHLIVGILMFSNARILPVGQIMKNTVYTESLGDYEGYYSFGNIGTVQLGVFIGLIVGIFCVWVLFKIYEWTIRVCLKAICRKDNRAQKLNAGLSVTDNLFGIMRFRGLKREYKDAKDELDKLS